MKFFVQFSMDNAAFDGQPSEEVARILRQIAQRIEDEGDVPEFFTNCRDSNGNTVGTYAAKPDTYAVKE